MPTPVVCRFAFLVTLVSLSGCGDQRAAFARLIPAEESAFGRQVVEQLRGHHFEGAPLDLVVADPGFTTVLHHTLGAVADGLSPEHVVEAGDWQAARSTGAYSLVGCVVGPGFDFADFRMLRDWPAEAAELTPRHPDVAQFL